MQKHFFLFLTTIFLSITSTLSAATFILPTNGVQNYTLQLQATVSDTPASITIEWPKETGVTNYTVFRKLKDETSWGTALTTIAYNAGATTYTYTDTNVTVGVGYEYQVVKNMSGTPSTAWGYIYTGIALPIVEHRGTIILIIDSTYEANLTSELAQLKDDLAGDGWAVISHSVARNASVSSVKTLIRNDYQANPSEVKAVFLFGHVPVPYAGQLYPDGHANHNGAWPADVYYGDMDESAWTDVETWPTSTDSRQTNIAGDGKFDQSNAPTAIELQVGRVDLSNMSTFAPLTELDLLRQYLTKDHQYKHKIIAPEKRAMMVDRFGTYGGESFSLGGWRNFSALIGSANIATTSNYFNTLSTDSYLWTLANGAGTPISISGFATTANFAANSPKSVFNMLFGSYFGDWDYPNNVLRAPLASSGWGLASMWMARPQWHLYHMAMGEPIGYGTRITQQNTTLYQSLTYPWNYNAGVHTALMGDPSLRDRVVSPISNLTISNPSENTVSISWTASSDSGLSGYHVYRSTSRYGVYTKITTTPTTNTSYTDLVPYTGGNYFYMVRAVKLETSPSGTYYNQSQGIISSITVGATNQAPTISLSPTFNLAIFAPSLSIHAEVTDDNLPTTDAPSIVWSSISGPGSVTFSDPNNETTGVTFSDIGTYTVRLTASDGTLSSFADTTISVTTDTQAPSTPGTLIVKNISTTSATLYWTASTDDTQLSGYKIYKNGVHIGTTTETSFQSTGLTENTAYTFSVRAYDIVSNESEPSNVVTITTTASTPTVIFIERKIGKTRKSEPVIDTTKNQEQNTPIQPLFLNSLTVLSLGSKGAEVKELQEYLNKKGFVIALSGPGSPGKENEYFGPATKAAVTRLQSYLKATKDSTIKVTGTITPSFKKLLEK